MGKFQIIMLVIQVLLVVAWALVMIITVRNNHVYEYRKIYLMKIDALQKDDITNGQPWQWRLDALNAVAYSRMVWHFWRPLDSFYPDRSFLIEGVNPNEVDLEAHAQSNKIR